MSATLVSIALLIGLALWIERSRETDLADASGAVTATALHPIPGSAPALRFADVAEEVGIEFVHGGREAKRGRILPEDTGSGLAWADADGDGDFDLYLVSLVVDGSEEGASSNRLYRNDGVTFVDVTVRSGTADADGFGMGASFADYDDDGDADLHVTNWGANRLFRNRGDGTFEEVASQLGIDDAAWSIATAWGDFDRDGRLDLYVSNYVDFDAAENGEPVVEDENWEGIPFALNPNAFDPEPNRLFLQQVDGTFTDRASGAGASDPEGRSMGVAAVDFDSDGWLDLYVANDVSPNALLRSLGSEYDAALFEDASSRTGTADPRGSMGVAVGGLAAPPSSGTPVPDLFVTHWVAQENALYQAVEGPRGFEYRDRTRDLRLGEISTDAVGWGAGFVDLDLDGLLDLAVANGSTLEGAATSSALVAQRLMLLWNGGERFHDLARTAGAETAADHVARGLAVGDYDGDGDADLAVSVNRGRPLLLRNDSVVANHALAVRLEGRAAAVAGARVEVEIGGHRQVRWWGSDASYASDHAPELLFGLGENLGTAVLRVYWAGGGATKIEGVRPRTTCVVVHG